MTAAVRPRPARVLAAPSPRSRRARPEPRRRARAVVAGLGIAALALVGGAATVVWQQVLIPEPFRAAIGSTVPVAGLDLTVDSFQRRADAAAGVGTRSMRERAEEQGGSLRIAALSPSGTRVEARMPLPVPS